MLPGVSFVVFAGGGLAGVAGAAAAARRGQKVALLEKTILPGGLATSGLVYIYLPLCDGKGTQVLFGLAEELMNRSLRYGPGEIHPAWRNPDAKEHDSARLRCSFSPASCMLSLDEVLDEAGVDVWFDTLVCDAVMEGNLLVALEVENKSGRGRVEASAFVDATGDADVARRAGAPVHDCLNSLSLWNIEYNEKIGEPGWGYLGKNLRMQVYGKIPSDETEDHNNTPKDRLYRGLSGHTVSEFVRRTRRELREYYQKVQAEGASRDSQFPLKLPVMAQFRKTYSIDGHYTLDNGEFGRRFEDSIGMTADWRRSGEVWEIPYRTLLPQKVENLLVAGRCSAAVNDAWEVTRVIPTAALTGEAAGIAAAMAAAKGVPPSALNVAELQKELKTPLHLPDVGLAYL